VFSFFYCLFCFNESRCVIQNEYSVWMFRISTKHYALSVLYWTEPSKTDLWPLTCKIVISKIVQRSRLALDISRCSAASPHPCTCKNSRYFRCLILLSQSLEIKANLGWSIRLYNFSRQSRPWNWSNMTHSSQNHKKERVNSTDPAGSAQSRYSNII